MVIQYVKNFAKKHLTDPDREAKIAIRLMFEGNREALDERFRCECCCEEHTYLSCPARIWHGCKGSFTS